MTELSLSSILLLLIAPVMGKLTQWVVNACKSVSAFADSTPAVKQVTGLIVATILGTLATKFGLHLSGTSLDTVTTGDAQSVLNLALSYLLPAVNSLLAWAFAMLFHNGSAKAVPAAPGS